MNPSPTAERPTSWQALNGAFAEVARLLDGLIASADEQYTAVQHDDLSRLEDATVHQEALTVQLKKAEQRRTLLSGGESLQALRETFRKQGLSPSLELVARVEQAVVALRERRERNLALFRAAVDLTDETLRFLHRLTVQHAESYAPSSGWPRARSVLVDRQA